MTSMMTEQIICPTADNN